PGRKRASGNVFRLLPVIAYAETPENIDVDVDLDGLHGAVAEGEVAQARVKAAEDAFPAIGAAGHVGDALGQIEVVREATTGAARHSRSAAASRRAMVVAVVDAHVADRVAELRDRHVAFAEHEGVAGPVGDGLPLQTAFVADQVAAGQDRLAGDDDAVR